MGIERALTRSEHVGPFAPDDLAYELPAMPGPADNRLDGRPLFGQGDDRGVGLLASQITFILQPLSTGEEFGIDFCRADRAPDRPHGFPDGIEKGRTRILHQVPAIGDLDGVRQGICRSLAITAATVAGHDADLGMVRQPSLDRRNLAVG